MNIGTIDKYAELSHEAKLVKWDELSSKSSAEDAEDLDALTSELAYASPKGLTPAMRHMAMNVRDTFKTLLISRKSNGMWA